MPGLECNYYFSTKSPNTVITGKTGGESPIRNPLVNLNLLNFCFVILRRAGNFTVDFFFMILFYYQCVLLLRRFRLFLFLLRLPLLLIPVLMFTIFILF